MDAVPTTLIIQRREILKNLARLKDCNPRTEPIIMRRKAIFFDRDNTLIANHGYLGDPDAVRLVDGAAEAIARGRSLGYAIIVISNQSGVARGMFDESAVRAVNSRMEQLLAEQNSSAVIDHNEFCPFHPDGVVEQYRSESDLRKPQAGMIYRAREALALDLQGSWVIGDSYRDVEAGRSAGCRTILFSHPDLESSPDAGSRNNGRPDHTCTSLEEAMDFIETAETHKLAVHLPSRTEGGPALKLPAPLPESVAPSEQVAEPRLEALLEQMLAEFKRSRTQHHVDFSVTKLLAGIVQIIVIAVLLVAYLNTGQVSTQQNLLLLAITLQGIVVAATVAGSKHR
jgi:D,D-heptose 1,7-bisphosphate phosphatase